MADYWISRDKYFCKYCNIYIADDKPSRLHHETGLRHKGNYERYIRDIYKKGAQQKRDRAEEAKELARVEATAAAAMGLPPPEPSSSSSASTSKPKPTPTAPTKPADPYANYTTAANLGIRDEAAERAAAEAEQRRNEGVIGSWQKVVKKKPPPPPPAGDVKGKRRAVEEWEGQGFAGQAVLKPELAGAVKREPGGGEDDRDERKTDSPLAQTAADDKPRAFPRASTAAGDDHDDDESNLNVVEAAKKRGFLSEKSAVSYDDDDDPLAKIGPIKLKKRRLTVKEQQAEEEARLAKQREVEEILKAREESRGGGNRGWAQVDRSTLEAEEAEFDPHAGLEMPTEAADEPELGPGEGEDGDEKKAMPVEAQGPPAGGLFKKRKRPGAMKSK